MVATDKNRRMNTFGYPPPDPSQIELLSDAQHCDPANAAFDSVMTAWSSDKSGKVYPKANLYVYRVGPLYAVLYPDWKSTGAERWEEFMFFDSRWKYLGTRAQ
jgi:hypothetical protein